MSLKKVFAATAALWASLVLIALSARGSFGEPISWSEYAAWILLAGAPAFLAVLVARGMPSQTVAQVRYDEKRDDAASHRPARQALPPLSSRDFDRS